MLRATQAQGWTQAPRRPRRPSPMGAAADPTRILLRRPPTARRGPDVRTPPTYTPRWCSYTLFLDRWRRPRDALVLPVRGLLPENRRRKRWQTPVGPVDRP